MIDPKELRIGNWINANSSGRDVQLSVIDQNETISVLSAKGNSVGRFELSEFSPIPITHEWLERFGFEKTTIETGMPSGRATEYKIKVVDRKTLLVVWFDPLEIEICQYFSEQTILFDHIKNVHQLQNLYFAITGTELEKKAYKV